MSRWQTWWRVWLACAWLLGAFIVDLALEVGGGEGVLYLPAIWLALRSERAHWVGPLMAMAVTVLALTGAAPWKEEPVKALEWGLRGLAVATGWGTLALSLSHQRVATHLAEARRELERLGKQVAELDQEARRLRQAAQASSDELRASQEQNQAREQSAEQALRDSEALYHSLVDHLPLSVLRKDAAHRYSFVSRKFLEFTEKSADDFLGKTDFEMFPEELAARYRQGDEQVLATGCLFDDVESFRKGDGEERFIQVLKTPVRDAQQNIIGTQVMFWDVTDRKRVEEEFRRQTEVLESILRSIADGVVVADQEGNFLQWNPAAERIIGMGPTERPTAAWPNVYGLYALDRSTPFPAEELPLARAMRGEDVTNVQLYICNDHRPDGVFVSVNGMPLRDAAGQLRGGVVVFRDVTQQVAGEEALRHSEERARRIVETAYDPFIAINAAGRIIDWNRQAESAFGWTREEALGQELGELIIPTSHRQGHRDGIAHFLKTGEGPVLNRRLEVSARHRDEHEFPVEITIWPLNTPDGMQFQAFVHDITDRRQAEDEIRSKNQDLETLLYVTSHDLREPLRAIENFSRMVRDRYASQLDAKGQDFLERVVKGAQRLDRLLEDVLTLSRVQRTTQLTDDVETGEIVEDVLRRLEARVRETQAQVHVSGPLPRVRADRRWATQAVQNLVSNALKYTHEGQPPQVEISPYEGPEGVGLQVADRGLGVPEEYAERIFGLFQRAVSRDIEGTGAGLAIVKRVAERHGGHAWVRPRVGGGSEFMITFGQGRTASTWKPDDKS
ncbi:MAG: PAS domain S-box protein [Planctomycetales bacterium]